MQCLGIPNTKPFQGITLIEDAYTLAAKVRVRVCVYRYSLVFLCALVWRTDSYYYYTRLFQGITSPQRYVWIYIQISVFLFDVVWHTDYYFLLYKGSHASRTPTPSLQRYVYVCVNIYLNMVVLVCPSLTYGLLFVDYTRDHSYRGRLHPRRHGTYICVCRPIYIYTYIHTYIHTYIGIYRYIWLGRG